MGSVPSCACIFFFNTNSELLPSKNPELMQCRPCCKPGHRCVRFLDLEQAGTCEVEAAREEDSLPGPLQLGRKSLASVAHYRAATVRHAQQPLSCAIIAEHTVSGSGGGRYPQGRRRQRGCGRFCVLQRQVEHERRRPRFSGTVVWLSSAPHATAPSRPWTATPEAPALGDSRGAVIGSACYSGSGGGREREEVEDAVTEGKGGVR